MFYMTLISMSLFVHSLNEKSSKECISTEKDSLMIPVYNYDQLKPMLSKDNDTTYVFNFWATWCVPCVQELPYFVELNSAYKTGPFKLVLISLDFKKDYLRKLQPFVFKRGLESHVLVLEDNRSDYWIEDIDTSWSGSIPATLVVKGKVRAFYERTFQDADELKDIVLPYLNL